MGEGPAALPPRPFPHVPQSGPGGGAPIETPPIIKGQRGWPGDPLAAPAASPARYRGRGGPDTPGRFPRQPPPAPSGRARRGGPGNGGGGSVAARGGGAWKQPPVYPPLSGSRAGQWGGAGGRRARPGRAENNACFMAPAPPFFSLPCFFFGWVFFSLPPAPRSRSLFFFNFLNFFF